MSKNLRFGLLLIFLISGIAYAQSQLVGLLSTSSPGVELQREGTEQWVTINVESVVSVGDRIRTGASGSATIRFINDDSYVTLGADTIIRIDRLEEAEDGYSIAYNVVQGTTEQVLTSPEDKPATYQVTSLGAQFMTRGGQFALEVDKDGNTDALAIAGSLYAVASDSLIEIQQEHGLRVESDGVLGEVVPAQNMRQLRVALDGVPASFVFDGDVLLNVRQGPNRSTGTLGTLAPDVIESVLGISEDGKWYRVRFDEGYGWVSGQSMDVQTDSTFLITYPDTYVEAVAANSDPHVTATAAQIADSASESEPASEGPVIPYTREELEVIAGLNQMRLDNHLWPLSPNATLTTMAHDQAAYLLTLPDWPADPHADAQGRSPRERAVDPDYQWPSYGIKERTAVGEVAYAGFNPAAAINYWQHSQIHFETVTNPGYREVGIVALPHPQGSIYIVVLGSRPDVFPALVDQTHDLLYLSTERYRFANGGTWITDIRQVEILPSILSEVDENNWTPWGATLNLTTTNDFALAYRGNAGQLVITSVKQHENVAWLPGTLPTETAVQAVVSPTATPAVSLPTSDFQPVTNSQVFTLQPLFPTNTPAPR